MADETDDDAQTGGMIALVPRAADASSMAVTDGLDADELHLTLAYLGDDVTGWPGEQVADLLDAVRAIAQEYGPVTSRVLARTVFNADGAGGKEPCAVYLMSDAPALVPMQDEAVSLTDVEQHVPYIPHVTGGYGLGAEQLGHSGAVVFDRIRVALGGSVTDFELVADDLDDGDDLDDDESLDDENPTVEGKAAPEDGKTNATLPPPSKPVSNNARPAPAKPANGGKKRRVASKAGETRYGLPIGTELGQARDTESARAAQAAPNAKARYDEFMKLGDTAAMKATAGKLGDDDLKSLSEIMYSFKTSDARVVAARNVLATELRRRGFDERDHGSLAGGGRAAAKARAGSGAAKKATGRKGSMSEVEDRAWRRRATDSGGRISASSLTEDARKKLTAAGWADRGGSLYPPTESKDSGYLGEHYEEKARFVRTDGGVRRFRKPIGAPITTTGLSVRGAMSYASLRGAIHSGAFKEGIRALDEETFDEVAQMLDVEPDLPADRIRLLEKERGRRAAGGVPTPMWTPRPVDESIDDYGDFDPLLGPHSRERLVIKEANVGALETKGGGRFVRTARGAAWFRKPIGSPIKGGTRAVSPGALRRADELRSVDVGKASRADEVAFADAVRAIPDDEIDDVAHVISTEEPDTWRSRSIMVELNGRKGRSTPRPSSYNQAMVMVDQAEGSDSDDPDYLAYLKRQGVDPDYADDGDMAAWRRSRIVTVDDDEDRDDGLDSDEFVDDDPDGDMDYLALSVDGELEVKRTTSKPWETGDLKKAGHTVSKEKGSEGDKYPIKTIGDLAAAVKRAKTIKDPDRKAKVWKHLRAEAKRLKAPNMVPADAPGGGDGKKKGGGFVAFKKGEKKSALDYALTEQDRRVLAAMEVKYASPDPRARRLRKYWSTGPGRAKWNSFRELRRHLAGKGVPAQMLNGLTANIYHAAKGEWPGRKADKSLDDAVETKVMISPELLEQMHEIGSVTPEMDDESALAAYDEIGKSITAEDDYEAALIRDVDWEMGLEGELERDDVDEQVEQTGPGMFDEDFEPLPDAEEDLLSAFGG